MTPVVLTMKDKTMIRNAGPDWSDREPYTTLVAALEDLQARGATNNELIDATMSLAFAMANHVAGPRLLSQRLYLIALKFAGDADLDAAVRGVPMASFTEVVDAAPGVSYVAALLIETACYERDVRTRRINEPRGTSAMLDRVESDNGPSSWGIASTRPLEVP